MFKTVRINVGQAEIKFIGLHFVLSLNGEILAL